jgi:hypothetical protein
MPEEISRRSGEEAGGLVQSWCRFDVDQALARGRSACLRRA